MTKPMTVNGFIFKVCHNGTAKYYEAIRGNEVVTAKNLNYLIKKVKKLVK